MRVKLTELQSNVLAGVAKLGYKGDDAQIISDVLLYAQMRGNNQGITKIATGGVPKAADVAPYAIVNQNKCAAQVSGGHSMVATAKAAQLAVELADQHGVGLVGSVGSMSSSGAIGYFAKQIADAGYIGLIFRGTPPFVAPYGSAEPVLGTNPFSYAFPTNTKPIVFDMATSIVAGYGVIEAKLTGQPLPDGIAYDHSGKPTTNAAEVWPDGSIITFGGYKGFALSLLTQLLGGPFVGGSFAGLNPQNGQGTFVMAIDPGLLRDRDLYLQEADQLIAKIKSAAPLPGQPPVALPSERGDAIMASAIDTGEIEIADAVWNELISFVG